MVLTRPELIAALQNEVRISDPTDEQIWHTAERESKEWDHEESLARIRAQHDWYATALAHVTDAALRSELIDFDGNRSSRGAFIVNLVLGGCVAYRTQLFLYLKACGHPQLNSSNLWSGVDAVTA